MTPDELIEAMGALLRSAEPAWERTDPAFAYDAAATPYPAVAPAPHAVRELEPMTPRVRAALAAARERDAELNLFTSIHEEAALADAAAVDRALAAGEPVGPLAGMTVAVKDLVDVRGVVTLAGSRLLADQPPAARDATVVARLRDAGAAILGSANMDELAYGFTTENTHYGPTRNPRDPARVAGGSSGGPAAAVAAGVVDAAIGSDTNGSIRVPAAFCGVYGLRPTYGLVPLTGAVLFAASEDTLGPIARSPEVLGAVLDVIAGPDGSDPICRPFDAAGVPDAAGARVARAAGELWEGAADGALAAAEEVAAALGATRAVDVPGVQRARAAATVITAAEGADQHQRALRERPDVFDPRTVGRLLSGLTVRATDYLAAQRYRRHWQRVLLDVLDEVDVLVTPTMAVAPPVIGEDDGHAIPVRALLGRFTQPFSFAGVPAITVPVAGAQPLPWGVQLVARPGADRLLIELAGALRDRGVAGVGSAA